jgi:hypothetical protein
MGADIPVITVIQNMFQHDGAIIKNILQRGEEET